MSFGRGMHLHLDTFVCAHTDRNWEFPAPSAAETDMHLSVLLIFCGLTTGYVCQRKHIFVDLRLSWSDAQQYCRQHHVDLSVLASPEENQNLKEAAEKSVYGAFWIGLERTEHPGRWQWTNKETLSFDNWGFKSYILKCVSMVNGQWYSSFCTMELPFFCFEWEQALILGKEKSWEVALSHCRSHYTDLPSLLSEGELLRVKTQRIPAQTTRVWTSVRFLAGEWLRVDEDNTEKQVYSGNDLPSCPKQPCAALNLETGQLEIHDCQERLDFICYANKQVLLR